MRYKNIINYSCSCCTTKQFSFKIHLISCSVSAKKAKMVGIILILVLINTANSQHIHCHQENVTCVENDLVKIYWDLNGLHQEDFNLINFIKQNILVPPDKLPLEMVGGPSAKRIKGQFQQVPTVEKLLELKKNKKKGFFIAHHLSQSDLTGSKRIKR